ncbi:MAG TPA: cytochrome b/b6 domain-containing protein [Vicinamibacteria bacterium]|nr:cytochrome b/b6 domain-containing protein [Vicinamibacteria bacterium]
MSFFQWELNPWGQEVLTRISWDLFWLSVVLGALFIIGHLAYRARHKPAKAAAGTGGSATTGVPDKVERHSLASRLFHWVMAVTVFVLLVTGFFPVLGIQFNWVLIHWVAGIAFIGSVLFHIIHASFWMNLRDIWVSAADWREFQQEIRHALGKGEPPPKPGKYPVDHRLFHHMTVLTGFGVMLTGLFMMVRIETPFFARNPYLFSDGTWGFIYVVHGLSAVGLVGMIMAHIYFAVLPEKRWLTIGMIAGWISKEDFLANHDPKRWAVNKKAEQG